MKLLLCGDLCPTETTAPLFDALAVDALFGDVRTLFAQSDFSFVNLECALTDSENRIQKFGPNLKGPKNTAKVLHLLGVDLCGGNCFPPIIKPMNGHERAAGGNCYEKTKA